jgi:hypothetical protein
LAPGGFLVIGRRERLPSDAEGISYWAPSLRIFAKALAGTAKVSVAG